MTSDIVIDVDNLSKQYRIYQSSHDRLRQLFSWRKKKLYQEFWALRDVSFQVARGETLGVMGCNGSGKSTLLQMIFGATTPTLGTVTTAGRISALLELGAGFDPGMTGRENVYLNAAIMGLKKQEIDDRFDEIAAFADIGDFIDQPVRVYSSGMYVRLAFAVAINVDPDILIVDEALAVGDARFQQRCIDRISKFRDCGVSILYVSHDIESVRRICDRAIVLNQGEIVKSGTALDVTNWYLAFVTSDYDLEKMKAIQESAAESDVTLSAPSRLTAESHSDNELPPEFQYFRHGDGDARIISATLADDVGNCVEHYQMGETLHLQLEVEYHKPLAEHIIGMHIRDARGTDVIVLNTYQEKTELPAVHAGERLRFTIACPIDIKPGWYSISATVAYGQHQMQWMDWVDCLLVFRIVDPRPDRLVFGVHYPSGIEISCSSCTTARAA